MFTVLNFEKVGIIFKLLYYVLIFFVLIFDFPNKYFQKRNHYFQEQYYTRVCTNVVGKIEEKCHCSGRGDRSNLKVVASNINESFTRMNFYILKKSGHAKSRNQEAKKEQNKKISGILTLEEFLIRLFS